METVVGAEAIRAMMKNILHEIFAKIIDGKRYHFTRFDWIDYWVKYNGYDPRNAKYGRFCGTANSFLHLSYNFTTYQVRLEIDPTIFTEIINYGCPPSIDEVREEFGIDEYHIFVHELEVATTKFVPITAIKRITVFDVPDELRDRALEILEPLAKKSGAEVEFVWSTELLPPEVLGWLVAFCTASAIIQDVSLFNEDDRENCNVSPSSTLFHNDLMEVLQVYAPEFATEICSGDSLLSRDGVEWWFSRYDMGEGVIRQHTRNEAEVDIALAAYKQFAKIFINAYTDDFPPADEDEAKRVWDYCVLGIEW